jgi:hypothetical protein
MACYTDLEMAAALRQAGVGAGDAAYLVATAHPESGGCGVMQQGQPYSTTGWGPWQITPGNSEPQCGSNGQLFGLSAAACAAAAKLRSQGLGAWTTIVDGLYIPYFSAAKQAVASVYNMSESEVTKLVQQSGKGGSGSGSGGGSGSQTTGFSIFSPSDWIQTIEQSVLKGFGVTSFQDLFIRGGLILLGGLLIIVGLIALTGKGEQIINVAAPGAPKAVGGEGASSGTSSGASDSSEDEKSSPVSQDSGASPSVEEAAIDAALA